MPVPWQSLGAKPIHAFHSGDFLQTRHFSPCIATESSFSDTKAYARLSRANFVATCAWKTVIILCLVDRHAEDTDAEEQPGRTFNDVEGNRNGGCDGLTLGVFSRARTGDTIFSPVSRYVQSSVSFVSIYCSVYGSRFFFNFASSTIGSSEIEC